VPTRVVCCGLATLDLTYVVGAPPRPDEKVVARELRIDVGGPALNAARTVVALGGAATLVTALGIGELADLVRARLAGITVIDVAEADHVVPVSTVMADDAGRRSVVSTNAAALGPTIAPPLPVDAAALLLDGHLMRAGATLAVAARERSLPVVLDGGSWKAGTAELLPHVTVAALSADFHLPDGADPLTGVIALGAPAAVRTHGSGPVEVLRGGIRREVPVPEAPVVDTLGAGDVFHGALVFALASGADLHDAVAGAAVIAAESVRHAGALGWAASSG